MVWIDFGQYYCHYFTKSVLILLVKTLTVLLLISFKLISVQLKLLKYKKNYKLILPLEVNQHVEKAKKYF